MIRRPAMTMLELLIVLAVLAGMAAVAWPALRGPISENQLRESANAIGRALDDARQLAIDTRQPVIVRLETNSDRCWVGSWKAMLRLVHDPEEGVMQDRQASDRSNAPIADPDGLKSYPFARDITIEWVHWDLNPVPKPNRQEREERLEQASSQLENDSYAWHLPLLPNGQGRDATIRLRESDSGRTVDVRYHASQGVTEVSL